MSGAETLRRWLPPAAIAIAAILLVVASILDHSGSFSGVSADVFLSVISIGLMGFPIAGAALVRKHPGNPIGWMFTAAGPLLGLMVFSQAYVDNRIIAEGASGGFADFVLWMALWAGTISYTIVTAGLLLLFPTGHLLSRRWRPVAALTIVAVGLLVIGSMFGTQVDDYPQLVNPYGVGGTVGEVLDAVRGIAWILLSLSVLLAGASLVIRFRRSTGVVRLQLKWMAFATALLFVSQASWFAVSTEIAGLLTGLSFMALPAAVWIAISRYQLYEIDRIINRTLVYGSLTAVLAGTYLVTVLVLQRLLEPITPQSDIAVAASTLAVAALFRPLRSIVQGFINRRFYRSRYDAQLTLERFGARLRDEVDLDHLKRELVSTVSDTMQPAHVSLWTRDGGVAT